MTPRLAIERLSVGTDEQRVIDDVTLSLTAGARHAIVGESGAGKSLTAAAILRLLRPPLRVTGGAVRLDGVDLLRLDGAALRAQRGTGVFAIFQNPATALNPCARIETQVRRAAARHDRLDATDRAAAALDAVRLPRPSWRQYPSMLSGGMQQRVLVAMALVLRPRVLIADEPTTGLDPVTQRDVLGHLERALDTTGASLLFITHDLRAAGVLCRDVSVMAAGRITASGAMADLGHAAMGQDAHRLAAAAELTR